MDFANLNEQTYDPSQEFAVELDGPDGSALMNEDGSRATVWIVGQDSDVAAAARNANTNKMLAKGARAKVTAESSQADAASYLAKISTRWNFKTPFTVEEARKVYANQRFAFIREQIDTAHAERGNFLKRS